MGRAKPAAPSPLKKCPTNRSDGPAWIKRELSPPPVETMTLCSKINNLPAGFCLAETYRKRRLGFTNTFGRGGRGKRCLLFPGQLLHFALNQSVNKMQKQPQEQRPDPKKIPPSTMKALAGSPCCCKHTTPLALCLTNTHADKKYKAQRLWAPAEQKLQRSMFCTVINFGAGFFVFHFSRHMRSPQQRWGGNTSPGGPFGIIRPLP